MVGHTLIKVPDRIKKAEPGGGAKGSTQKDKVGTIDLLGQTVSCPRLHNS